MRKGHHDENGIYNSNKCWRPLMRYNKNKNVYIITREGQKKDLQKIVYF